MELAAESVVEIVGKAGLMCLKLNVVEGIEPAAVAEVETALIVVLKHLRFLYSVKLMQLDIVD